MTCYGPIVDDNVQMHLKIICRHIPFVLVGMPRDVASWCIRARNTELHIACGHPMTLSSNLHIESLYNYINPNFGY